MLMILNSAFLVRVDSWHTSTSVILLRCVREGGTFMSVCSTMPLVGYMRDAFGTYAAPLLLTFSTSVGEIFLLAFLMRKDFEARAGSATLV